MKLSPADAGAYEEREHGGVELPLLHQESIDPVAHLIAREVAHDVGLAGKWLGFSAAVFALSGAVTVLLLNIQYDDLMI
ncbi:hypothetical protein CH252_20945 [Rhodococcus sp. 06-1477-1B]|nr:hypothetical protein CH252_20945 [Rhodococcus sp. 06-1477-1B]